MKILRIILFFAVFVCLVLFIHFWFIPNGLEFPILRGTTVVIQRDWDTVFFPAMSAFLNRQNPYSVPGFFNPPWVFLLILPLYLLGPALATSFIFVISMFAHLYVSMKLKTNLFLTAGLISWMFLTSRFSNIDGLVILGFVLPPSIGLFFVLLKPQVGLGVAIYWIVNAWCIGGLVKVVKTILPVTIAFILSFIMYGFWPLEAAKPIDAWWNTAIFPNGVFFGFFLLYLAFVNKKIGYAIASAPLLSPYVAGNTWAVVYLGLLSVIDFEQLRNRKSPIIQ